MRRYRILVQQNNITYPGAPWREQPTSVDTADTQEEADYLAREYQEAYGPGFRVWYELTADGQTRRYLY